MGNAVDLGMEAPKPQKKVRFAVRFWDGSAMASWDTTGGLFIMVGSWLDHGLIMSWFYHGVYTSNLCGPPFGDD